MVGTPPRRSLHLPTRPEPVEGGRKSSSANCYATLAGVDVGDGFPVRIVGAINVSPESFYVGSVARGRRALQQRAARMVAEGADLLDVGAMSTAPYVHGAIGADEEVRRMVAAIRAVREVVDVPISADTQRAHVAAAALEAGASVINDISGLRFDPAMGEIARAAKGMILMASEPSPSRQAAVAMITTLLRKCLVRARRAGIPHARIVLDPGIGFFRQAAVPWHILDCRVLDQLSQLRRLGSPLLVGVSRKSFIGKLTGRSHPDERLFGSLAATAIAVYNGAAVIRTHDVAATVDVVRMAEAIRTASRRAAPPPRAR
jgi:dihydropteroate synthase